MVAARVNARSDVLLLVSNILIIYARQGAPAEELERRLGLQAGKVEASVSVVTIGESLAFAKKQNWGEKRQHLLRELLRTRIVPVDINRPEILDAYADLDYYSQRVVKPARTVGKNDLWIAATANVLQCTLVTTDADFDHFDGVKLACMYINPATLLTK